MSSATSEGTVTTTAKNTSGASNDNIYDKSDDKEVEGSSRQNDIDIVSKSIYVSSMYGKFLIYSIMQINCCK